MCLGPSTPADPDPHSQPASHSLLDPQNTGEKTCFIYTNFILLVRKHVLFILTLYYYWCEDVFLFILTSLVRKHVLFIQTLCYWYEYVFLFILTFTTAGKLLLIRWL